MTVKQLKELLNKMPDDAEIVLIDYDSLWQAGRIRVSKVEIEEDGQLVLIS